MQPILAAARGPPFRSAIYYIVSPHNYPRVKRRRAYLTDGKPRSRSSEAPWVHRCAHTAGSKRVGLEGSLTITSTQQLAAFFLLNPYKQSFSAFFLKKKTKLLSVFGSQLCVTMRTVCTLRFSTTAEGQRSFLQAGCSRRQERFLPQPESCSALLPVFCFWGFLPTRTYSLSSPRHTGDMDALSLVRE